MHIYMYDYYVNIYIYMHTVGGSTSSEINFATAIGQKKHPDDCWHRAKRADQVG